MRGVGRSIWALAASLLLVHCGKVDASTEGEAGQAGSSGEAGLRADAGSGGDAGQGGASGQAGEAGQPSPSTRLVPWQLKAAGAPPLTVGIYDREQQVHCAFMLDEVGQMRCLPVQGGSYGQSPENGFVDAKCTQRAFPASAADASAPGDPLVSVTLLDGISCGSERHSVGHISVLPADSPIWYLDANGQCQANGPSSSDSPWLGVLVDRVPPEAFVAATESAGPLLQNRLRLSQMRTSDGALFSDHFVDERYGKPCTLENRPGAAQCWPTVTGYQDFNFDSSCLDAPVFGSSCTLDAFIEFHQQHFALGAPYEGELFGVQGCEDAGPTSKYPWWAFFKPGPLLAESDLVVQPEWRLVGTGRLLLRGLAQDDGSFLAIPNALHDAQDTAFEDSQSMQACTPIWTPEGKVRCIPADAQRALESGFFGDANCTKQAYACDSLGDCAGEPFLPETHVAYGEQRANELRMAVEVTEPVYVKFPDESCHVSGASNVVTAGDVVPWTQFPELAELYPRAHSN